MGALGGGTASEGGYRFATFVNSPRFLTYRITNRAMNR